MQQRVMSQLVAQGNPNPPGRPAGPGQAMPVYQGVPNAPWDGAARGLPNAPTPKTVTAHTDQPSNTKVTSSHVIKPWAGGEHELIREGQITLVARTTGVGARESFTEMTTEASMQHLNSICARGYAKARQDLIAGNMPANLKMTVNQFDEINELDLYDYMGRREADLTDPDEYAQNVRKACELLKLAHFKYLRPIGMAMHWNLKGVVNNISYGTSPQAKVNESTAKTIVVNNTVAKDAFVSNVFGDNKHCAEGGRIGLIIRRAGGERAETVGHPEIVPWSDRDSTTPLWGERGYWDEWNRFQLGFFLPLGTVSEMTGEEPAERKRRDAVGNNGKLPGLVHDALGSLPLVRVQLGI